MTVPTQPAFFAVVPQLGELTTDVLFGDVWQREGLSPRDRSLVTVAALVAMHRPGQIPGHLNRALDNGVTPDELRELVTHLAFYAGWPCAVTAAEILGTVLAAREGGEAFTAQ
jgi:4-carboxymuconolactone decarboxylase